uniref:Uncharacterized protein n=1 Tax=Arundo donax TaxID=35708 RepID=A0A0A9G2N5_ARUDO
MRVFFKLRPPPESSFSKMLFF